MDINTFKELFCSLSQISQLKFEVWDEHGLVFFSETGRTDTSISKEIEEFSAYVMSQAMYQYGCFKGRLTIFGVPIRNDEKIVGALLAYHAGSEKSAITKTIDSRDASCVKEMERLLTNLTVIMEDKWNANKERDKLADELSDSFEDLYLYSNCTNNITTLKFTRNMQKHLAEELLKTMRAAITFVSMRNCKEDDIIVSDKQASRESPNLKPLIESLLNLVHPDTLTLKENYFLLSDSRTNTEYSRLHSRPYRFLGVKVIHEGNLYGWIGIVSFNIEETFRRSELKLLISMAEQLAMVIANTDLYKNLEKFIISMIKSLICAIEAKDVYTRGHSERVNNYCLLMADYLGLGENERNLIRWASILHDVGKIGVPEAILNKPGRLDDEEYKIIKEHPANGYKILQPIDQLSDALPGILHHHESYDGKGYPDGLKGEEIPLIARIIAIVDTFDAITSKRAYRSAKDDQKALAIIDEVAGTQLDPYLVSVFKEVYNNDIVTGKQMQTWELEASK